MAGRQTGVTRLVALRLRLRFGLVQGRIGRLQAGLAPLQFGTADEVLGFQRLKALEFSRCQIALTLRRAHLGLGRLCGQLKILCIHQRQQLANRHALPRLGGPLHQFSAHTKSQPRLHPRPHLGRVHAFCGQVAAGHGDQFDRAQRLLWRIRLGTCHQSRQQNGKRAQTKYSPGGE